MAIPGDNVKINMKFEFNYPVKPGERFSLRDGEKTFATGMISKL